VNIDITWVPSGASVRSYTVGMHVSENGAVAAFPARASSKAVSR
jgi:hypothetical protein